MCSYMYIVCLPNTLTLLLPSLSHSLLLVSLSYLLRQSPLASEDLNVSEYTHRILFGGRTAESFPSPSPLECREYPFKVCRYMRGRTSKCIHAKQIIVILARATLDGIQTGILEFYESSCILYI